ncbi:MAG: hypothetical protein U0903_09080 [Planctomycetales bacterium]
MVALIQGEDSLRNLFSGLTEQTFQVDLGIVDPPLIDYLSDLLVRFTRMEAIYRLRNTRGRPLREVTEMLVEAQEREAKPRREIFRHIGDFTLFWTGVFPETLTHLQGSGTCDALIDYSQEGKRSYFIASTFKEEPFDKEAPVLHRLSEEFELCSVGLRRVRAEWEREAEHHRS